MRNGTKIIGISSGKGGVGKSTLAVNLALALKKFGKHVTIVDCNLSTPHLSYYLGTDYYGATLNDVLLGKAKIQDAIHNYEGIRYIPASLELKDLVGIELAKFKSVVKKLSPDTDYIILDSAPGLGREAVAVLHAADELLFVATPFVSSINDIIRCIDVVKEFGNKKIRIVLNMVSGKRYELLPETVEEVTGIHVIGIVPFDIAIVHSLAFGSPVLSYRPDAQASIAFMKLAATMAGAKYKPPNKLEQLFTRIRNFVYNRGLQIQQGKEVEEEFIIKPQ